jgi:ATP/maltotriose-dependent transcriptional regulator MalT
VGAPGCAKQEKEMNEVEPLTRREGDVLTLVAQGLTNRQIAAALVLGEATVCRHLNTIYSKLGVTSRLQAALKAQVLIYAGDRVAANTSERDGHDPVHPVRESSP